MEIQTPHLEKNIMHGSPKINFTMRKFVIITHNYPSNPNYKITHSPKNFCISLLPL